MQAQFPTHRKLTMSAKIGANPIIWSNDDMPELGGETPLETCLAEAHSAGMEGLELGNKFPRTPDALRAALAPHGLACISGWYSCELLTRSAEDEIAAMQDHLQLLRAMGSPVMIFAETSNTVHTQIDVPLSARPVLDSQDWQGFARRLTIVGDAVARAGLKLVYHHHMGTVVQTPADIDTLMRLTGESVHLLLDTGHAWWGGADPAALAARYRDRIAHVHTKDVRPAIRAQADAQDWSFLRSVLNGVFTVPGDGEIDFPAVFRNLPGYDGWVVIEAEQDPARANPLTYARMGRNYLARTLHDAGLLSCRHAS
ncbi:myo-inosose-2 dehydratase [Gluconacetobacter diazotrophicus]|nr:myo-inosose-2 dehydratase [Gluconacetobacter diazotrophicus]